MSTFRIYNTLSSKKEKFTPLAPPQVGMYVCGITPYGPPHLGHARCYIVFDVLKRLLEFLGYEVKYVQNITDIDDKIIEKSIQTGKSPREIADSCTKDFIAGMNKLNIKPADKYPKVSQTIPEIINFVSRLIEKNMAYETSGSVYFRISRFHRYGCLSGRCLKDARAGEVKEEKESQEDFALWKKDEKFGWDSPWGKGRPGWHIECSVMSSEILGNRFDIHGGGLDLVFPHHENEIAQSTALTGKVPANYWVHNGMVTLKGDKMAKSTGNFFLLSELLEKYDPMTVRMYILGTGYRQKMDFNPSLLQEEEKAYGKLVDFKKELLDKAPDENSYISPSVNHPAAGALMDDLNTPAAIGEVFKIIIPLLDRFYSGTHSRKDIEKGFKALGVIENILGIKLPAEKGADEKEIQKLLVQRQRLREKKYFDRADRIREKLYKMGIKIKDTPTGPRWKKINKD